MKNDKRDIFFRQNTFFGVLIGLSFILASYIYFLSGRDVCLNPQLHNILLLLSIAGAYIGARKYREESSGGYISYAKALGVCTYLITIATLCYGIYIFGLYSKHPELVESYVRFAENTLRATYMNSPLVDNMVKMMESFTTPIVITLAEIFNKILTGFIFSLFVAGLLRRNPKT